MCRTNKEINCSRLSSLSTVFARLTLWQLHKYCNNNYLLFQYLHWKVLNKTLPYMNWNKPKNPLQATHHKVFQGFRSYWEAKIFLPIFFFLSRPILIDGFSDQKLIFGKWTGAPKNWGVNIFPDPIGHFGFLRFS